MQQVNQRSRSIRILQTTTFRLTAMLGMAFLCAMCALLGLIYVLTERELVGRTDEVLQFQAKALATLSAARLPQAVRAAILADASHLNYFALLDARGHALAENFEPPQHLSPGFPVEVAPRIPELPALRVLTVPVHDGGLLVIGRDISQIADLRSRMLAILLGSGLLASVLLLATAVALSAAPLRRVRILTALANRIAAGELTLRMPVSNRDDELDAIATTVNAMIEEIARLLDQVKGVTDAIAHDLRSPLAQVRSRLDEIRRRVSAPPGNRNLLEQAPPKTLSPETSAISGPTFGELIDTALEELDTILARFSALLRIAELEATNRQACFAEFDPMALAVGVCELFQPLAEERSIRLSLGGPWGHIIFGDERLLFEVVSNLVENAIKFIAPKGQISVAVTVDRDVPMLVVRDDGPGIPLDERASVLRRYYRGSSAHHIAGSGLGLSLVAEILHLHGYSLELEDANPGLEVRIICNARFV